jgi:hypothetical protein
MVRVDEVVYEQYARLSAVRRFAIESDHAADELFVELTMAEMAPHGTEFPVEASV